MLPIDKVGSLNCVRVCFDRLNIIRVLFGGTIITTIKGYDLNWVKKIMGILCFSDK